MYIYERVWCSYTCARSYSVPLFSTCTVILSAGGVLCSTGATAVNVDRCHLCAASSKIGVNLGLAVGIALWFSHVNNPWKLLLNRAIVLLYCIIPYSSTSASLD